MATSTLVSIAFLSERPPPIAGMAPGWWLRLRVTDTGVGISESNLSHVFEPFFTTKKEGTGLGLATCYGIVRQLGGFIALSSRLDQGTTADVYLPCLDADAAGSGAKPVLPLTPTPALRILLVEDNILVRRSVSSTLQSLKHAVRVVERPEDALRLLQEAAESIDLMITDVVMPGMTGPQLAEHVRVLAPGLKILFISGYTENSGLTTRPGEGFLAKPFVPMALGSAIGALFDSNPL